MSTRFPSRYGKAVLAIASTALAGSLAGCSAQSTSAASFIVGSWDCTQTGTAPGWKGGNSNGTGYLIQVQSDGTIHAQMLDEHHRPINNRVTLKYTIADGQLTLDASQVFDSGPSTVTTAVPGSIRTGDPINVAFSGPVTDRFSATVDGKTVKGIHWADQVFTCSPSKSGS